jgi:hypothetical protein
MFTLLTLGFAAFYTVLRVVIIPQGLANQLAVYASSGNSPIRIERKLSQLVPSSCIHQAGAPSNLAQGQN